MHASCEIKKFPFLPLIKDYCFSIILTFYVRKIKIKHHLCIFVLYQKCILLVTTLGKIFCKYQKSYKGM